MVEVISAGFYTTVQDLGRMGYHDYGVPYSGAMDAQSAKLANALLANEVNAAVLELTMTGPTLRFGTDTQISITGADISPKLNEQSITMYSCVTVAKDDVLSFGRLRYGFRAYIAVSGGFQTELVMDSRSMYNNLSSKSVVQKSIVLPIVKQDIDRSKANAAIKTDLTYFNAEQLSVYEGPEFNNLSTQQQERLFMQTFMVSKNNNRMAYQLDNPIANDLQPIITSLVQPGTVQLPPSGTLIVLMRDGQTAGGYPRVLQLSETAINQLSQKKTGDTFCFVLMD